MKQKGQALTLKLWELCSSAVPFK